MSLNSNQTVDIQNGTDFIRAKYSNYYRNK